MILILDNYDSFTWNLYHYVEQLCDEQIDIRRNDEISITDIAAYKSIILSPGPGLPCEAGIMPELLRKYSSHIPILGICLGHQAIAESYGAKLENLDVVLHGVERETLVLDRNEVLFKDSNERIKSGHYHSWVVSKKNFPEEFNITAVDSDGNIMAIAHKTLPLKGVQFHPESIMTEHGLNIITNWLRFCGQLK